MLGVCHGMSFWHFLVILTYVLEKKNSKGYFVFFVDFEEFQNLLIKQSPIEGYTEWLDDIVDKCVLQVNELKAPIRVQQTSHFVTPFPIFYKSKV